MVFPAFSNSVFLSILRLLVAAVKSWIMLQGRKRGGSAERIGIFLSKASKGVIAHRGGIPENTVHGFEISKSYGATSVEVDLQFTCDDHPILFHDESIDRITDQCGYIADLTLEEIKKLDVGAKFGPVCDLAMLAGITVLWVRIFRYTGVRVATLSEALLALKKLDMYMFLELKSAGQRTITTLEQLFRSDNSLYDRIIVLTFYPDVIGKIRSVDSNILVGLCVQNTLITQYYNSQTQKWKMIIGRTIERWLYLITTGFIVNYLGIRLILPDKVDILNGSYNVKKQSRRGIFTITWTVNEEDEKNHFANHYQVPYMTDVVSLPKNSSNQ